MTKGAFFSLLFSSALMLGVSTQAAAQDTQPQSNMHKQPAQQQNGQNSRSQAGDQSNSGSKSQPGAKQGEEDTQKSSSQSAANAGQQSLFVNTQKSSQILTSSILGLSIQNSTGEKAQSIGTINDLIMNEQHQLVGVVVGIGGFLGVGEKNVGIAWNAVKNIDPEKGIAVVTVTKKQLQNAPAFTSKQAQKEKQQQQRIKQQMQQKQQQMAPSMGQGAPSTGG